MLGDGVLGVGLGGVHDEIVRARVENRVLVALEHLGHLVKLHLAKRLMRAIQQLVDDALPTLAGVELLQPADENHHLASVRDRRLDQLAKRAAGLVVVRADVQLPVTLGSIGVVRDQHGLLGRFVEERRLVLSIDGADGDALDTLGQQCFQYAFLVRQALGRHVDLALDAEFRLGLMHAGRAEIPEWVDAIGHVGDASLV